MNPDMFEQNVTFAKSTGLDTFYFWGVEWWYWMQQVQHQPQIWNEAKSVFHAAHQADAPAAYLPALPSQESSSNAHSNTSWFTNTVQWVLHLFMKSPSSNSTG